MLNANFSWKYNENSGFEDATYNGNVHDLENGAFSIGFMVDEIVFIPENGTYTINGEEVELSKGIYTVINGIEITHIKIWKGVDNTLDEYTHLIDITNDMEILETIDDGEMSVHKVNENVLENANLKKYAVVFEYQGSNMIASGILPLALDANGINLMSIIMIINTNTEVAPGITVSEGIWTISSGESVSYYFDLLGVESMSVYYMENEIEYESICTYDTSSTVAEGLEGAKYNCKVDPNKPEYTFYLLDNNEDGTSDLIMNANINASGEAVIPGVTSDTGVVMWYENEQSNINGPVTAMTYLYNATKSWTNVEPLNYTYNDREVQGITATGIGYQSFVSTNGIGIITKGNVDGTQITIGSSSEPLRARMPIYSSDASITEVTSMTNASYLYDNLDTVDYIYNDPGGYWTLSSFVGEPSTSWYVSQIGYTNRAGVNASSNYLGVRPVITVKL